MSNYSDEQTENEYNASMVWISGIRHWTFDKLGIIISNNVRNLEGLDTRWAADVAISASMDMSKLEQAYGVTDVTCNRTWGKRS